MSPVPLWQWAAAGPVLIFLAVDALMGWLDPAYWLDDWPLKTSSLPVPSEPPSRSGRVRTEQRPAPPWPDEAAMRLMLGQRGLRLSEFQWGPQRMGANEVRLTLQWQGPLGATLELWQSLALDMPQMVLEGWVMQALTSNEWRVVWRGHWLKMAVPQPVPPQPPRLAGLSAYARARPFDPVLLRRELARLWPNGQPSVALLRLVRPEDLHLVAVMHLPEAVAWVSWQHKTLPVRVGDRLGEFGARVQAIEADHVQIMQGSRILRIAAVTPGRPPAETP